MADTTLISGTDVPDLVVYRDDLLIDDGVATALLISLFSDSRVEDEAEATDGLDDVRGWWADDGVPGWGSTLWQFEREKAAPERLPLIEASASEALAWLVSDGIMREIAVTASIEPIPGVANPVLVLRVACVFAADGHRALYRIVDSADPAHLPVPRYLITEGESPLMTEDGMHLAIEP